MKCRWCNGTGKDYAEAGSSLYARCPDCNGTGELPQCEICGQELTTEEEVEYGRCEECKEEE